MQSMNSYELSRKWFDWCFENPEKIRPIHTSIYFFAIEHCNRLGWKKKFGFPSQMVMEALGIKNWKTYSKALNEVVEFGFIDMLEVSRNQYSANIIAIVNNTKANGKADTKALDKALSKHRSKQVQSQYQSTVSIDKQVTKNNKQAESYDYAEELKVFNSISSLFDSKYYNTEYKKTKWLDVIRLLHTADGYSYSLIESVIAYAKADTFWSANVLSIASLRKKTNDVSKFDNIKAKFDGSGTTQRKQLNEKLKYATPKEMLPHFDNEQAMNDSLQSNTYVSNGEKIFPLRSKDGTRNKDGDYIIGGDKQLHKITV